MLVGKPAGAFLHSGVTMTVKVPKSMWEEYGVHGAFEHQLKRIGMRHPTSTQIYQDEENYYYVFNEED